MTVKLSQVVSTSDWIKIIILLIIAIIAWFFVFQEYSKPLDLETDIKQQKLYQDYETRKLNQSAKENNTSQ